MTQLTATNNDDALDRITRIMPELALDHHQRHSLMRHLHRVGMTQLMRREPTPHTRLGRSTRQLLPSTWIHPKHRYYSFHVRRRSPR
jgi:hypothetical protein